MDLTASKMLVNYVDYEIEAPLETALLRDANLNNAALLVFEHLSAVHEGLTSFTVDRRLSEEFSAHAQEYEALGGGVGRGIARIYHGESKTHNVGILIWSQEKPQNNKKNSSFMLKLKKWWEKR